MIRRATTIVVALLLAISTRHALADSPKPNVLLISIDDLNDWVGCLGGHPQARTPNIDKLASRGVLFTNAHCQGVACQQSRAALMTGLLPSTTGLYFLSPGLNGSEVTRDRLTLTTDFAKRGYKTMGVGKIYHGGAGKGYFQEFGGRFGGFGPRPKKKINYPIGHPLWDWGAFPDDDAKMPDTMIADWAIDRLKQKHDKPFFLAAGFHRPHVPLYVPPKWFADLPLADIKLPEVVSNDRDDLTTYGMDLTIGHPAPRHEWFVENKQWRKAVQAYLACNLFVDHCVGRVLDALAKSDYADNTIVVLFSDHGWHLGEKQRWAKRSLWEDGTRVPLIIAGPNIRPARSSRPAGLIDIYPTLLDLCEFESIAEHEGHSLRPLLAKPDTNWPHAAITTYGPKNHSVRSTNYRYIRYADGSEELYDHRTDPHEWHNIATLAKHKPTLERHRKWLPKNNHPVLPKSNSSGLTAYLDAEKARKKREEP